LNKGREKATNYHRSCPIKARHPGAPGESRRGQEGIGEKEKKK